MKKAIKFQQLTEFVQNVGIGQEIGSVCGTVLLKRRLNLFEEIPQFFLRFTVHYRRSVAIQTAQNMRNVFIIGVKFELLQNFTDLSSI